MKLIYDIVLSIGAFSTGIVFILYESAWSWRQRTNVEFVKSPYREIIGVIALLWGVIYAVISIKKYINNKNTSNKEEAPER
jgi:hypothetical protein